MPTEDHAWCHFKNMYNASFTVIDLVVELSESIRTKQRMDLYVVVNPSGTRGGGLFRDKYEEHCIKYVKDALRKTHGGLDDIKLEKEIGGISVMTALQHHSRDSLLRGKTGKEHSKDMIGDSVREQIEENVSKYNPFNTKRAVKHVYYDKPKVSPYAGLVEEDLERFIARKKKEYDSKYR